MPPPSLSSPLPQLQKKCIFVTSYYRAHQFSLTRNTPVYCNICLCLMKVLNYVTAVTSIVNIVINDEIFTLVRSM